MIDTIYTATLAVGKGHVTAKIFKGQGGYGLSLWDGSKPFGKSKTLGSYQALALGKKLEEAKSDHARASLVWATLGYDSLRVVNDKALASAMCHPGGRAFA